MNFFKIHWKNHRRI